MANMLRFAGCVALLLSSVIAHAQLTIGGTVYDDGPALALRQHFVPRAGVTVKLYRDGGDRTPSADDAAVSTTTTNAAGVYSFRVARAGDYWVAVDSRTVRPGTWPEQTFGPSGALCVHPDGSARATYFEGPCIGGRTNASDNASALATSEHVAGVTLRDTATDVDFAFSFNLVTSTRDGDAVQGSLRQFIVNANAVDGPARMRFVPVERAPEQREPVMGTPPRWWSILLASPLPEIAGADTIIDGTAFSTLSPASVVNTHAGRLGEPATIRLDAPGMRQEKPELELVATGDTALVCTGTCAVRALAVHGAAVGLLLRADARIEHVVIGAAPDGHEVAGGATGMRIDRGTTVARHVLIATQTAAGVYVSPGARVDGESLEISRCGSPQQGGGIVILSDGSSIRSSIIAANQGVGVVLGATDGSQPANGNVIDGCTISLNAVGILFAPGSTRNVVTRNDIMWNRLGGATVAPFTTAAPRENRVSANRFDENGLRPIVLDIGADPNTVPPRADSCARNASLANGGISPPRIDSVHVADDRVVIRGRACPGEIVEVYQSYMTFASGDGGQQPSNRSAEIDRDSQERQRRDRTLPSIGEFNYLGATSTTADGAFEAAFPLPSLLASNRPRVRVDEPTDVWAKEVMPSARPEERAFAGIAIDAAGNTSEMSVRRQVD